MIFRYTVNSVSKFFLNSCTCAHSVRYRKPLCGPSRAKENCAQCMVTSMSIRSYVNRAGMSSRAWGRAPVPVLEPRSDLGVSIALARMSQASAPSASRATRLMSSTPSARHVQRAAQALAPTTTAPPVSSAVERRSRSSGCSSQHVSTGHGPNR